MSSARFAQMIDLSPGAGGAVTITAATLHKATCPLCRGTARRWLSRGTVSRVEGDMDVWRQDADAEGDSLLACPGCDGALYLEPVRFEGGTPQWALTAYRACSWPVKIAVVLSVLAIVLLMGTAIADAAPVPEPTSSPVVTTAPTPAPVADPAVPGEVVITGVSGDAAALLATVAGLSLATSAAALIAGWNR